ncbi:MAG: hypothetical protein IPM33_13700 [Phycisphaerales bacterium]|nr:hypothetical protein [Phycisphaerales bacterium]
MLKFIDEQIAKLGDGRNDALRTSWLLDRLRGKRTIAPSRSSEACSHEFGNGAMSRLDEFSSIIWPDEVPVPAHDPGPLRGRGHPTRIRRAA